MAFIQIIVLAVFVLGIVYAVRFLTKKKTVAAGPVPVLLYKILKEQVPFYQQLSPSKQNEFEKRVAGFLTQVKINGVNTQVTDQDRVLIGASAIIPIFNFPQWEYSNLHEVLLYPDSFNHEYKQQGTDRNILGMVGSGAMNHVMILSQHELRQAFINKTGKENTAIHEFVHLLDKSDGDTDGVPEYFLDKKYMLPWLQLMHQEINKIMENQSDINPYGATNKAEFFAVVSEYFFEQPALLKEKHPQLYDALKKIFAAPQ